MSKILALFLYAALISPGTFLADQVSVRYAQGQLHGFVVLRSLNGKVLGAGDLMQNAVGDRVTTKLLLRFKDGSVHEETAVFSQRDKFQIISYDLIQKGPSFKRPMETSIDVASGQVTVRYTEKDGQEKTQTDHVELPADLANGIVPMLLNNVQPTDNGMSVSMLAATPKPRIVKLVIVPQGQQNFSVSGFNRTATKYAVQVQIGGPAGVVAPLVGKQPPDTHIWILGGTAPVFLKSEGPLYEGGPIWRLELLAPTWPGKPAALSVNK